MHWYFTSIDCTAPTVPTAGKDDVSFRASFLLKAMSQDLEGGREDGLFSLQLKLHPAERQTLCLRGWFSPRHLLLRREGPAAGSRAACWPPLLSAGWADLRDTHGLDTWKVLSKHHRKAKYFLRSNKNVQKYFPGFKKVKRRKRTKVSIWLVRI